MDAVHESNPEVWNLEEEITNTRELIQRLSEIEEPLIQREAILREECNRLENEIYRNKHRKLTDLIRYTMKEVRLFEEFPSKTSYYADPVKSTSPLPTAKELAEPIQRTKIQFHHKNRNLATERKMARVLRQHERERQQQLQVQAEEANKWSEMRPDPYYVNHRYFKPLPHKPIKNQIMLWAEKIKFVSSLVLRDSKNSAPTRQAYLHLEDLKKTGKQFFWPKNVDKVEFAKEWGSMKRTRNSFAKIKFDLANESRRHEQGYAESKRVEEKHSELWKVLCQEVRTKLRDLQPQKRAAQRYLVNLQKKQKEVQSRLS